MSSATGSSDKYFGVGKSTRLGEGLGLLPIKLIPHWESDYSAGLIIDWDSLLNNLDKYKENLEVLTLKDGEFKTLFVD